MKERFNRKLKEYLRKAVSFKPPGLGCQTTNILTSIWFGSASINWVEMLYARQRCFMGDHLFSDLLFDFTPRKEKKKIGLVCRACRSTTGNPSDGSEELVELLGHIKFQNENSL